MKALLRSIIGTLILFHLCQDTFGTCAANSPEEWNATTLDESNDYKVFHKVEDNMLHLRLSATTATENMWLGFGLAEQNSGHMKGSDILTVEVSNGKVKLRDQHVNFAPSTYTVEGGNGYAGLFPVDDHQQDWIFVSSHIKDGRVEVYAKRTLKTNDTQDREVEPGHRRIIWAHGNTATQGYHMANRGAGMIQFIKNDDAELDRGSLIPQHDGTWTFTMTNYTIEPEVTTYACQSFNFPTDKNRHVVAIRPKIDEKSKKYPHHAILHICENNSYFNDHKTPKLCTDGSPLASENSGCASLMWSWASGMNMFVLPEEAGFLVGSSEAATSHVILEIHYDNPQKEYGKQDNSGFEVLYVDTLRTHNAAGMTLGDATLRMKYSVTQPYISGNLPVSQSKIHRQSTCPSECTQKFSESITVFGSFLHTHNFGQKIYTELYDNESSTDAVITNRIDFFDNGFQAFQENTEYIIHPGQELQTHCFYNTNGLSSGPDVEFGAGTADEMCMDFIFYYPAQFIGSKPLANCGMFIHDNDDTARTLCGAVSEPSSFLMTGQQYRGDTGYADPLNFGISMRQDYDPQFGYDIDNCGTTTTAAATTTTSIAMIVTNDDPADRGNLRSVAALTWFPIPCFTLAFITMIL